MSDLYHHLKWSRALLLSVVVVTLSACGGDNGNGSGSVNVNTSPIGSGNTIFASETSLTYGDGDLELATGKTMTPVTPHKYGETIISYAVTPTLPAGLSLNATNGIISGTPSAVSPRQIYTITGTYNGGVATTGLKLEVLATELPPAFISYHCVDCTFVKGQPIVPLQPGVIGGEPALFIAQHPLPPGLILDSATGVISGTPTSSVGKNTYILIASNDAGESVPYYLTAEVQEGGFTSPVSAAPANLSYGDSAWYEFTLFNNLPVDTLIPTVTNSQCKDFRASPKLPAGLTLATDNGYISGTPTALTGEAGYKITCTDIDSSATTSVTLTLSVTNRETGFLNGGRFFSDGTLTWTKITDGQYTYPEAQHYCETTLKEEIPGSTWELPGLLQINGLWKAVSEGRVQGQGWNFSNPVLIEARDGNTILNLSPQWDFYVIITIFATPKLARDDDKTNLYYFTCYRKT